MKKNCRKETEFIQHSITYFQICKKIYSKYVDVVNPLKKKEIRDEIVFSDNI